ncbi:MULTISPECIES: streptophobe family protein [unclassified Streptomyces]|uniref:streptophobe family protein n=1 Tax=unclassified Streptomyces TaxID=2593676 RepID=UPI002E31BD03|nr:MULTISPECIES: streptophobe family protein [unclassified Streptomyces]WUC67659.1 streptophobe family protein [Streptomyces sp. NBC_00539]
MSSPSTTPASGAVKAWRDGFVAVVAAFAVMFAVASAGTACAGAGDLPGGAYPRVVAAVVVMAAGGSVGASGGAGPLAGADVNLSVMPLSVALAGALTAACAFLRPLRGRAVAGPRELLGRAVPLVVLWLLALMGTGLAARQTFGLLPGDSPLGDIGELLDSAPTVGFETDLLVTFFCGLLWIVGLLVVTLLVSRRAPLPASVVRFHTAVRPAAFATLVLLLTYVALAVITGLVVAVTRGHPERTLAVMLLGLPNLAWLALSLGLGGAWKGRVDGPFGLPMPHLLDEVLRGPEPHTVDVSSFAHQDPRAWWLVVVAAVLLLGAGVLAAVRSPAGVRPWRHALHLGVALALAMLTVCLLTGVQAGFGLSLLGIGDVGGLGEKVDLTPVLWRNTGLALLWGAVAGYLGALLGRPLRHRGPVESKDPARL